MGSIAPHAKSTIYNSQHCTKQQTNSTTAQSNDPTDHSVADTLPIYASNSVGVHHMPMERAPTTETKLLNSIVSSMIYQCYQK